MQRHDDQKRDVVDDDLYEELDDEELHELVEAERQKALQRARDKEQNPRPKRRFPKWIFWVIAIVMVINIAALLPRTFALPVFDFIKKSATLSAQDDIQAYKQAVVVVETDDGRGTGFAISKDGTILTNDHVVDGEDTVTVAFPEEGLFKADVISTYSDVDLAVLDVQVDQTSFPHLNLADQTIFSEDESIYFIGNPLRFQGIANEGNIIGYTELADWDSPVLMLDAPIYKGNSGSPVINDDGEVIGIVFATLDHDTQGRVGLAVPIDYYYNHAS